MALAPNQGILAHRNADGSIHTYVAVNRSEKWLTDSPVDAIERVSALFSDWVQPLLALIAGDDQTPVIRPIYQLPTGLRWPRVPGVTLLGDAAHLMSPFAGEGANLAMLDGVELARALVDHPGELEGALTTYERKMFSRSRGIAEVSASNLAKVFGPDAPMSVVDLFGA